MDELVSQVIKHLNQTRTDQTR